MSEPTVPESDYLHMKAEVERLKLMHLSAESELMSSKAREKALRAITGEMWNEASADRALMAGYELAVDEWDRRAEAIR